MRIVRVDNYKEMSKTASDIIKEQVILKKDAIIGFATGSSPLAVYECLAEDYKNKMVSFKKVRGFQLDEYYGLERLHSQSFYYYMKKNFMDKTDFDEANFEAFDALAADINKECSRYETLLAKSDGIDIQILGIGNTGHIGFNEPAETFPDEAHFVKLEKETIDANAKFFANTEEIPKYAFTLGIGSIMKAKKLIVLVNGRGKSDIIKKTLCGPITPKIPATVLRLHPDCTLIADKEALELVEDRLEEK